MDTDSLTESLTEIRGVGPTKADAILTVLAEHDLLDGQGMSDLSRRRLADARAKLQDDDANRPVAMAFAAERISEVLDREP